MKEKDVHAELSSIREMMERSSKFISLSGLSGVLAGIYALAGAGLAYTLMKNPGGSHDMESYPHQHDLFWPLFMIAMAVLVLSMLTGLLLSIRKAKSRNENIWNPVSRRLLGAVSIPMFTGAFFIGILLLKGEYSTISSASLVFYGLALVAGSQFTFIDVKWLGIAEIILGLLAMLIPGHGLIIWAIGFGFLHILYGIIMHFKYER